MPGIVEKERKAAEKKAKFEAKQAKLAAAKKEQAAKPKKEKKEKEAKKEEAVPEYVEETPKGEKKSRSPFKPQAHGPNWNILTWNTIVLKSLDDPAYKSYNPTVVESAWYDWWEKEGFFKPEFGPDGKVKPEGVFVIPAPPPNVTGALHIGHALTIAIQDTLVRW